jgi:CRISPR-associated protein Cas1
VDYSVYVLANFRISKSVCKKDYAYIKDGLVVLDSNLIRRFLELLERKFQKERKYDYKFGAKTEDGLKSVQEITKAKILVQNLADYCTGKTNAIKSY